MLKKDFLKILDEILSRKYLKEEEKNRLEAIKKSEKQLPEKIFTDQLIEKLGLTSIKGVTDEDGYFKEFINTINDDGQESQTEIFYLLKEKQVSCLHKLKTTETWQWLGGDALLIYIFKKGEISEILLNAKKSSCIIPENTLFGAKSIANNENFSLVTCRCAPGFLTEHYQNPSLEELNYFFETYPRYKNIILELSPEGIPGNLKEKTNLLKVFFQSFFCCKSIKKNEEQASLIDLSQNNTNII